MTISIKHNLAFTTELDETHPVGQQLMSLPEEQRIELLERMLNELIAPTLQPILDEINDGSTYALLKVGA